MLILSIFIIGLYLQTILSIRPGKFTKQVKRDLLQVLLAAIGMLGISVLVLAISGASLIDTMPLVSLIVLGICIIALNRYIVRAVGPAVLVLLSMLFMYMWVKGGSEITVFLVALLAISLLAYFTSIDRWKIMRALFYVTYLLLTLFLGYVVVFVGNQTLDAILSASSVVTDGSDVITALLLGMSAAVVMIHYSLLMGLLLDLRSGDGFISSNFMDNYYEKPRKAHAFILVVIALVLVADALFNIVGLSPVLVFAVIICAQLLTHHAPIRTLKKTRR